MFLRLFQPIELNVADRGGYITDGAIALVVGAV